jgi:hypothetical protein
MTKIFCFFRREAVKRTSIHFALASLLFAGTLSTANASLEAYYQFNNSSNLGLDTSGNSNNATNTGGTYTAAGYNGDGAVYLNGSSFLKSPVNVSAAAQPSVTWGAWVKPTVLNGGIQDVLSADTGGFQRTINIDSRAGGNWAVFTGSGVYNSHIAPSTTEWTFLAVTYDQAHHTETFFINNTSFTISTAFASSQNFFDIGSNPSYGEYFTGYISDVFVYNQTLNPTQINSLQTTGNITTVTSVPEPAGITLLAAGLLALLMGKRRKA